ncbi:amidohydrolase [uncultured Shewanella sp.]|uniref:amidohydrolase n=1 Tax=uncultured Shewanella sp. TaxID=173975 RepID=UPI0026224231|nr:amidohydrolase [uncultured Shewanella sp.]
MHLIFSLAIIVSALTVSINAQALKSNHLILSNAIIYGHSHADTIVVTNGKIVYIGKDATPYYSYNSEIIDLEQSYIMPGFIDNHNHVFEAASEAGGNCELNINFSLEAQIPALKRCRSQTNSTGWIMGYGFSLDAILTSNNRYTPLEIIDRIFPNQPIVIMEQTSHSMWVNSAALTLANITKASPDPQGGKILKDQKTGQLNGILLDNAGDIVMEMAWNHLANPFNQSYDGLINGLEEASMHGITTIGDGRLYWKRGWLQVWLQVEKDKKLTSRVSLRPWIYPTAPMTTQLNFLKQIQSSDKSRLLLTNQVKMYSDGLISNGTAKIIEPYKQTYIPDNPNGINYISPHKMSTWLTELNKIGYSAHIHAIGDLAVRESLNAIEHIRQQGSKKPYTLTHLELVNNLDIPRFNTLDVTADFQVGSDYIAQNDHQWAIPYLGRKRAHALMDPQAIFNTGANVTLSSDWNVNPINPLVGIANSVKMGSTGLPDINTAIDAYTINAAESLGISDITGSLTVGKSADFVILENDITHLSIDDIANTPILMTILQGKIVYDIDDSPF